MKLLISSLLIVFLTCSTGYCWMGIWISSYEECMDKYLEDTNSNYGTRVLAAACTKLYGENPVEGDERDPYECFIDDAIHLKNDTAVKVAASRCLSNKK
jgi:hypothetical protein